jgi:hypothetical protein
MLLIPQDRMRDAELPDRAWGKPARIPVNTDSSGSVIRNTSWFMAQNAPGWRLFHDSEERSARRQSFRFGEI